jgi:hypothetical protein
MTKAAKATEPIFEISQHATDAHLLLAVKSLRIVTPPEARQMSLIICLESIF